jgi:hypothetical protein
MYCAFCFFEPYCMRVLMQPTLRPGYMANDQLAVPIISDLNRFSDMGRPWPPNSVGKDSPCQPPSTNCW